MVEMEKSLMRFNIDSAAKLTNVTENAYVYPQVTFADLCLKAFSRKWALPILKNLFRREIVRFSELEKLMPGITSTVLSDTLLKLEHEGLISKKVYPEIPPRVEYKLTGRTRELKIILEVLDEWARRWKFSRIISEGART
jgi:DNA-binding HxlR family transcriptional regulator